MPQVARLQKKYFFGMTVFQISVLFFLGLLACGVIGLTGFLIFNSAVMGNNFPALDFSNPSQAIIGKWQRYIEPTPTPTQGATPTPIVIKDIFGKSSVITPASSVQIIIGCDFAYPPNIEFFGDKTYTGLAAASLFSDIFVWQGGQYEILDGNRIKMQTKNGFAVYQFIVEGDSLKFTDDDKCEFIYIKAK